MDIPDDSDADILSQFETGIVLATDPQNVDTEKTGQAITTLDSFWIGLECPNCQHTFRLGDRVNRVTDRQVPCHLSCPKDEENTEEVEMIVATFFSGLQEAWTIPESLVIKQLAKGDPLLAPPFGAFRRRICKICANTFRLHDQVVVCPCQPQEPLCGAAIHYDPVQDLYCWDEWNTGSKSDTGSKSRYCPVTSRQLDTPT
jgi:hypothetical protein